MTPNPFVVPPDAPLNQVARAMARRKIGSAIVVDGERVAGVFTTTDALLALVNALESPPALKRPSPVARTPRRAPPRARAAAVVHAPDARGPRRREARLAAPLRGRPPRRTRRSAAR
jgi:CBS domain-containing protein